MRGTARAPLINASGKPKNRWPQCRDHLPRLSAVPAAPGLSGLTTDDVLRVDASLAALLAWTPPRGARIGSLVD